MRQVLLVMVAVLVGAPAFLIGSVHIQTQVLMVGCVGIWLLALLFRPAAKGHPKRYVLDGWFWWLLAACVFTALQLIPIPSALLAWLSPKAHEIFSRMLADISGAWPSMRPLSLSPPETSSKLIRDVGVLLLFMGALLWAHHRWHLRMLLRVMVIAAMALSGLVLLQTLLRVEKPLMGLYTPTLSGGGLLMGSPLVNMNHLGGYLLFHSLLAFVLSLDTEERRARWFWAGGGMGMGFLILLTLSRGAILVYLLGMVSLFALVGYSVSRRRKKPQEEDAEEDEYSEEEDKKQERVSPSRMWVALWRQPGMRWMILVGGVVFAGVADFASSALYQEFRHTSLSLREDKLSAIYDFSVPLIRDFPLVGVGRGAMGMAWHRVSSTEMVSKGRVTATHVESALLQPLVDWGMGLGLLWLLWGGWLLWRTWRGLRGLVERGAFLAVVMLLLQNFVDFNIEFFATAFPCFMLLGVLRRQYHDRKKSEMSERLHAVWVIGLVGLVVVGWCVPSAWSENYRRVHAQWNALEEQEGEVFERGLVSLMSKRPSDYLVALLVARHYNKGKHWQPEKALKWLGKAQYLNPTDGSIALLRAYTYARLGLYQDACAWMERGVEMSPPLLFSASYLVEQFGFFREALKRLRNPSLMELVILRMLRKKGQEALFFEAKEALFAKFPKELWLYRTSLELLLQKERELQEKKAKKEIDEDAAKKQSEGLFQEMRALLFRVRRVLPEKQGFAAYYKARVLHAEQRPLDASLAYEDALRYRKSPYYWQSFLELMSLRLASRQESELRVMFLKGRRQTNDPNHLGALFFFYGRMLLQRYAYREALEALEAAVQHNAKADAYWFSLAEVCAHLGSYSRSLGIYRRYLSMPQYASFAQKQIAWVQKMERASRASRDIASPPSKNSQE